MKDSVIFDTEFTAWEGSNARNWSAPGEYREIVQIGAIRIDPVTFKEKAAFSILVRPRINGTLSAYFTNLTGITNRNIAEEAVDFKTAALLFHDFAQDADLWCYGRDIDVLNENTHLYKLQQHVPPFRGGSLREWFAQNAGDIAARAKAKNLEPCSGNMARIVGAAFNAASHSGLNDSRSLRTAIEHLVSSENRPNPFA